MDRGVRLAGATLLLLALALARGAPVEAAVGGPDGYGYTWTDMDDGCPSAPPLFGGGTQTLPDITGIIGPINLPFPFPWYGVESRRAWIDPAGYLAFRDPLASTPPNQTLPDPTAPNSLIAAHWLDAVAVTVRYEVTATTLHVQWQQLVDPAEARFITDLVIDESGDAFMRWTTPYQLDFVTIGHEDHGGGRGRTIYSEGIGEGDFPGPRLSRSVCIGAPTLLDCASPTVLRCGESAELFIPFLGESNASTYNCSSGVYPGDERVVRVIVDDFAAVTVSHDGMLAEIMRVDNPPCSEEACSDWDLQELSYSLLFPGDYWFVFDQLDALATPPFTVSVDCQYGTQRVNCGQSVPGDTLTMRNFFEDHGCAMDLLDGPEVLYRLTNPTAQTLTAVLDTLEPDLWVVIYDAATFESRSPDCLAAGRGGASVLDAPAGEYIIVVDGAGGAGGSSMLDVSCGQVVDCDAIPDVDCLARFAGDTTGSENVLVSYLCERDALVAGENIHRFTNPVQQTVRVRFLSSTPGQRLLLMTSCSSGSCLIADDELVACPRLPAGEFYVVVDGPAGSEGPYEIEIECGRVASGIDLQVLGIDSTASASDCNDFRVSGTVDVVLSNLGTEVAAAPFELVVFEDQPPLDGRWDSGVDQLIGSTTVAASLAGGELVTIPIDVSGTLTFRDSILHAQVDAEDVVLEIDETNNVYNTGTACEYRPPIGDFLPVLEWEWKNPAVLRDWDQVDSTPMVADVNGDGIPDVVVATGANPEGFDEGVVRALSGDDGRLLWTAEDPQARVWATSNLALADIDSDGLPEIIGHSYVLTDLEPGSSLVAIDDDGSFLWQSEPFIDHPSVFRGGGGASIADLDCDGNPEIVYGANAFNADGSYYWAPEPGGTIGVNDDGRDLDGALSVVVDVDGDGVLEVVAGPTCYELDASQMDPVYGVPVGRIVWRNEIVLDGFPAVGQFDGDPEPEIVITNAGFVTLLDGDTGNLLWNRSLPLGGGGCSVIDLVGGPPTVADVDGDCAPEIGVAGADWYFVLETNGTIKWRVPIVDCSSHRTASSVFDFDGDGAAELAFMDEERLHILRGRDGASVATLAASSHTWQEMITIADVDGDDNAEIILPLNDPLPNQPHGIRVIGDLDGLWVNTRRIWNQHAYHISNIEDDGSVPGPGSCEEPSWLDHNTYRDQLGDVIFTAPDVTMGFVSATVVDNGCLHFAEVVFRIGNGGGRPLPLGSQIWFYDGDPNLGGTPIWSEDLPGLEPGAWRDVLTQVPLTRVGTFDLHAVADDDGTGRGLFNECREFNNSCSVMLDNPGFGIDPPEQVGPALRATAHSDPYGTLIEAEFNWLLDQGLPRPAGDHYHLYRSTVPSALAYQGAVEPLVDPRHTDVSDRAREDQLPLVHFLKIVAADACEQEEQ